MLGIVTLSEVDIEELGNENYRRISKYNGGWFCDNDDEMNVAFSDGVTLFRLSTLKKSIGADKDGTSECFGCYDEKQIVPVKDMELYYQNKRFSEISIDLVHMSDINTKSYASSKKLNCLVKSQPHMFTTIIPHGDVGVKVSIPSRIIRPTFLTI